MTEPQRKLTREEMDALPHGARVLITWNGGNGPHKYEVRVDRFGARRFFHRAACVGWPSQVQSAWLVST